MVQIKNTQTGNCPCCNCGKVQDGIKYHPYTVWYKAGTERRGHNLPVCSIECAKALAEQITESIK